MATNKKGPYARELHYSLAISTKTMGDKGEIGALVGPRLVATAYPKRDALAKRNYWSVYSIEYGGAPLFSCWDKTDLRKELRRLACEERARLLDRGLIKIIPRGQRQIYPKGSRP